MLLSNTKFMIRNNVYVLAENCGSFMHLQGTINTET